ncbi:MAG: ABC transporter ATP-binding protein [Anaerocolumna sp.]
MGRAKENIDKERLPLYAMGVRVKNTYLSFLKEYILKQKAGFMLVCIVTILQSIITIIIPLTYKVMIDDAFPNRDMGLFLFMISGMMLCFVFNMLFNVVKDYLLAKISEKLSFQLRKELNDKLGSLPYSYFDTHNLSDVLSKYNKEVEMIKDNCGYMLIKIVSNAATLMFACVMIFIMDWRILVLSFIIIGAYIYCNRFFGAKIKVISETVMTSNEASIECISENYNNVIITKLYGAYRHVNKKFQKAYENYYEAQVRLKITSSVNINISYLLIYLLAGCIWVIGGFSIFAGTLTVGSVMAIVNYQNMLLTPTNFFCQFNNSYQGAVIAINRLLSVLKENDEKFGDKEFIEPVKSIRFDDVSFRYREGKHVLHHLNLTINQGEVTAFMGPSGCGKSTIMKLLAGFYPVSTGNLYLNQKSIKQLDIQSIRKKIALVQQDSLFYKGTILENLMLSGGFSEDKLINYSELLDLKEEILNLPGKWTEELSAGTGNLSIGQKKRLDILRALLKDADILIFDESTASIDIERRKKLFLIIEKLKENKIILFISHNIEECAYFDTIYSVKKGFVTPVKEYEIANIY